DSLSWNQYAYTRGDPVNRMDPTGLQDCPAPCMSLTPPPQPPNFTVPISTGTIAEVVPGSDRGSGGGDSATATGTNDITFVQKGLDNAVAALKKLATMDLSKCAKLLTSLGIDIAKATCYCSSS